MSRPRVPTTRLALDRAEWRSHQPAIYAGIAAAVAIAGLAAWHFDTLQYFLG